MAKVAAAAGWTAAGILDWTLREWNGKKYFGVTVSVKGGAYKAECSPEFWELNKARAFGIVSGHFRQFQDQLRLEVDKVEAAELG